MSTQSKSKRLKILIEFRFRMDAVVVDVDLNGGDDPSSGVKYVELRCLHLLSATPGHFIGSLRFGNTVAFSVWESLKS
jgi:hypothetical protein